MLRSLRILSILVFFLTVSALMPAQNRFLLKGTISDSNGAPIMGAGVIVKDTSHGTVSDLDGQWKLEVGKGDVLVISCLGYESSELTVGSETDVKVILNEDNTVLDETVVVGYATMKKRDLVGAVDQVDSKTIDNRPSSSLSRALQGQVAGLNISFTDSKPSRAGSVNVRGGTSIGAGGNALILIDGVEGDMNSVNPQDVASVSVLKDASSTAVYGARGAFGVILITTKNPEKGRFNVNYSGSLTANRRTVIYDNITDSVEWLEWWLVSYNNYYQGQQAVPDNIDKTVPYSESIVSEIKRRNADPTLSKISRLDGNSMFGWGYYDNFDWYSAFYKKYNLGTEHSLSVSGATDRLDYYVSGRYYGQDGVYSVGNENFKKYDIRAKGSIKIRPWLRLTNNMSFSYSNYYQPTTPREQVIVQRWMQHACYPLSGPKNPDGSWTTAAAISGWAAFSEGNNYRIDNVMQVREKAGVEIDIIKNVLTLKGDYSINYTQKDRVQVQTPVAYSRIPGEVIYESEASGDGLYEISYNTIYQSANAYVSYSPNLGQNHSLTALLGWNMEWLDYKTLKMTKTGFTSEKPSFSLMDGNATVTQGGYSWAYLGFFGRVNYSYKGKYLAELSARYDGSSKFPTKSKWGFFPSASLGWRLSDEAFMKWAKPVLSNAKIRLSVGSVGNGNVSPYLYTSEMAVKTADNYVLSGALANYSTAGSIIPASLTWETATTYDAGIDLDFLDNRLSLSADYYVRNTTDMYTESATVPAVYGATAPKSNNASLRTNGWEVSLQWKDQFAALGHPFAYSVKGTLWDSRSFVTKYAGNDTKSLGTFTSLIENHGQGNYYVGQEIGEIWGWTVAGLFKDQEDINNSAVQTGFLQSYDKITRPGQVKLNDLNHNGVIDYGSLTATDTGDLSIIGNSLAHYNFGLNLSASWFGVGLNLFFQGCLKRDWYPGADSGYFWGKYARPYFAFIPSIHSMSNPDVAQMNEDNSVCLNADTAYWPRLTTHQSNSSHNYAHLLEMPNTRYIQNAAYVRLKNIQIDYSFPEKVCKAIHIQGLKVFFNGENLLTFTPLHKYAPNFDPEGLSYDTDFEGDQDGNTYPVMKAYTIGLNITF